MNSKQEKTRCATRPSKWDRWHIRLPKIEDQEKVEKLFRRSGAKTKSDYVRARILGEFFKVITEDKSTEKSLRELSSILASIQQVGILYNEAVKALNNYHSVATAQRMLAKLERYSVLLIKLQEQVVALTKAHKAGGQQ